MTIYDRPDVGRAPSPALCLAVCLIVAMVLALLPAPAAQTIRRMAHAALRPGLLAATNVRHAAGGTLALLGNLGAGTRRAAKLEEELDQTRRRAAQLEAEIVWLRSQSRQGVDAHSSYLAERTPLVQPRLLPVAVLGRQAQRFLASHGLLDIGSRSNVTAGDLVLDAIPAVVQHGAAAGAAKGQLAIAGRRVWGKLSDVQPRLSLVMRTTDPGFRDLVCLAQPQAEQLSLGPRGVLRGTGEPLCRLEQVPLTQAVAVGQWVVTTGGEGLLDGALLYGYVERIEQSPGATHWNIWVRPAIDRELPRQVSILSPAFTLADRAREEMQR